MRIIFAGTPDYARTHLKALVEAGQEIILVLTQPDRPQGRGQKLTPSPVKSYAESVGIPVLQPTTLKDPTLVEKLKTLGPDLMVVSAYGMLLPQNILTLPRLGCWNLHASLLPRWRGAAPIQQSLLHGDKTTGITLMQMDEGLDTGPILIQEEIEIGPKETALSLYETLSDLGAKVLIKGIQSSPLKPMPQSGKASYAPKITKENALIPWLNTSQEIERFIRAYHPWPMAYTHYQGEVLKVHEAYILSQHQTHAYQPGEVVQASREGLDVATKDGLLRITRLQFPNKKALSLEEILNAKPNLFKKGLLLQ